MNVVDENTDSEMKILAVTSFRPNEILNSVAEMDATVEVVVIDSDENLLTRTVETFRQTRSAIRSTDPDVILLDCYEAMGTVVMMLAQWYKVPLVARLVGDTWRILEEEGMKRAREEGAYYRYIRHRISRRLNGAIFSRVHGYVVVSSALKDVTQNRTGRPPDRIGVVPIPISRDPQENGTATDARRSLSIDEQQVILSVTNLLFQSKFVGAKTVVEELEPILKRNADIALVVAGGGPYHARLHDFLEDQIDDPDVRRRIYVPGHVDRIDDLYALGDVFVYVSHLDGYPRVVLEAQAAGLPIVGNEAHGMTDQITDGKTGYLVDTTTKGELRERVVSLLANEDERSRLGSASRRRARSENSPETVSRRLESVLADLIES